MFLPETSVHKRSTPRHIPQNDILRELYKFYNEPGGVKVIKVGWLRRLGQVFGMQEQKPCRKLILHKPEGTKRMGRLLSGGWFHLKKI
jgi:hypothetical protein